MKGYSVWIIVQVEADSKDEARDIVAMGTFTPSPMKDLGFEIAKVEPWNFSAVFPNEETTDIDRKQP